MCLTQFLTTKKALLAGALLLLSASVYLCQCTPLKILPFWLRQFTLVGALLALIGLGRLCHRRALAIDSAYPLAYRKLGDGFFALGQYAEAVDAYQQAIALDPEDVAARQGLEAARLRAQ